MKNYYVKEEGWYYSKLHGPYSSREEAEENRPKDISGGRLEAHVKYTVEEVK